uniref:Uncharacterized protein n=1 Tax=Meloidogyne enterolobii TaxID=390850 RepID=A0A6V7XKY9_MELEN|nr:unnamed protein product [Meloidogyne enterolobii]
MLLSDRGTWQLVLDVHVKEEEQAAEEVHVLKIEERVKWMTNEMKIEYLRGTSLLVI